MACVWTVLILSIEKKEKVQWKTSNICAKKIVCQVDGGKNKINVLHFTTLTSYMVHIT